MFDYLSQGLSLNERDIQPSYGSLSWVYSVDANLFQVSNKVIRTMSVYNSLVALVDFELISFIPRIPWTIFTLRKAGSECSSPFFAMLQNVMMVWGLFSTYAKFSEKVTFLTPDVHTYMYVSGVKNVNFSENFSYLLNEWVLVVFFIIILRYSTVMWKQLDR